MKELKKMKKRGQKMNKRRGYELASRPVINRPLPRTPPPPANGYDLSAFHKWRRKNDAKRKN